MKIALMLTGQMRTFEKCYKNVLENVIKSNKDMEFDIYICTEYMGKDGGSKKNKFIEQSCDEDEFRKKVESIYSGYMKYLFIETKKNKIEYPKYTRGYGPYIALYRNKFLFEKIEEKYDYYLRMRPDIHFTSEVKINVDENIIGLFCGKQTRNNSWFHNRDWDHACISDYNGMKYWCEYERFLESNRKIYDRNINLCGAKGYWSKNSNNDISISTTQDFVEYLMTTKYRLVFDYMNVYTIPIR
jgi:hypothetical protein